MICLMHFTLEYLNSETASFPYEHLHEVDKARAGKGQRWGQRQRKCHTVLLLKAAGSIPAEEEEDWTGRTNVTCRYSRFGFIFSWIRGGKRNTFELLNNPSFKRESSHWDGEMLKVLKDLKDQGEGCQIFKIRTNRAPFRVMYSNFPNSTKYYREHDLCFLYHKHTDKPDAPHLTPCSLILALEK